MLKNVWITGASSGIGKALAIKFAKEGWQVAASARRENLLRDLNNQNQNIHPFPLDVRNETEAKNIFQNIEKSELELERDRRYEAKWVWYHTILAVELLVCNILLLWIAVAVTVN